jgi:hypothetical protein
LRDWNLSSREMSDLRVQNANLYEMWHQRDT